MYNYILCCERDRQTAKPNLNPAEDGLLTTPSCCRRRACDPRFESAPALGGLIFVLPVSESSSRVFASLRHRTIFDDRLAVALYLGRLYEALAAISRELSFARYVRDTSTSWFEEGIPEVEALGSTKGLSRARCGDEMRPAGCTDC